MFCSDPCLPHSQLPAWEREKEKETEKEGEKKKPQRKNILKSVHKYLKIKTQTDVWMGANVII